MVNSLEMLVLAGGFGTRLKGVINEVPKPMAPINGVPLLQLQLEHWIKQGQRRFIFLLHYQAEKIKELLTEQAFFFGSDVSIDWICEDIPLGTGGSICNAIDKRNLKGDVLICNADTWLDRGINEISKIETPAIGLVEVNDCARYGSIALNSSGFVESFAEKKEQTNTKVPGIINAGLYKFPTRFFTEMKRENFSLEAKILPRTANEGLLFGVKLECDFFDIGIPEDYFKFCVWHKIRQAGNEIE